MKREDTMTYTFKVPDMSCGHCKMHIENAFEDWGKATKWAVDLEAKKVTVESGEKSEAVARIITDVGYSPSLA